MRKLRVLMALVAMPALAFAGGKEKAGGAAGKQSQEQQTQQMQQGQGGKEQAVSEFRAEDTFFTSPNYDIEGRISSVSEDKIKIRREKLPEAELSLASNTLVELDGEKVSAGQLREGQEVRAKFNVQGDTAVALEVKAERREQQREQSGGARQEGGGGMSPQSQPQR